MYKGINKEAGKTVREEDAFMYAMERCTTDCVLVFLQEFQGYFDLFPSIDDLRTFREDLVEWFYSDNWIWIEN